VGGTCLAEPSFVHIANALLFVAACSVPIDSSTGGPTGVDASVGGGTDGGSVVATDGGMQNAMFPCKNAITANLGNGHHNAGQDCLNGCHNHGFTLAGTLYNAGNTAIVAGGSITVKDANGAMFDMVSQSNGNFYTSQAIVFPIAVYASQCPASTPMSETIATGSGGCNKSGCHASGAQGHVHL
jgi:hypothetical protein